MTNETQAKKESTEQVVPMNDGRTVTFAGKRKLLKESSVTADGKVVVRLDFRNGETRTFPIPDSLLTKFAAHGAEQKLGDVIAGLNDIDDAVLAVDNLIDQLSAGKWTVEREGNGMAGTSILARALAEVKNLPIATVQAFLKPKTQAEKIALRNNPSIKPVVERLEAEKAAKAKGGDAINTDALLAELG